MFFGSGCAELWDWVRAPQSSLEKIAKEHVIINFDHEFSKHSYFIMYFPKKPFKAFLPAVIPFIPSIPENLAVRNRITREKTAFSGMDGMNGMNGIIQTRKIPEPIFRIFEAPWGLGSIKLDKSRPRRKVSPHVCCLIIQRLDW